MLLHSFMFLLILGAQPSARYLLPQLNLNLSYHFLFTKSLFALVPKLHGLSTSRLLLVSFQFFSSSILLSNVDFFHWFQRKVNSQLLSVR